MSKLTVSEKDTQNASTTYENEGNRGKWMGINIENRILKPRSRFLNKLPAYLGSQLSICSSTHGRSDKKWKYWDVSSGSRKRDERAGLSASSVSSSAASQPDSQPHCQLAQQPSNQLFNWPISYINILRDEGRQEAWQQLKAADINKT